MKIIQLVLGIGVRNALTCGGNNMKNKLLLSAFFIITLSIGIIIGYFLPHTYHGKTAEQIAKTVDYYGRLHLSDQNKIAGQEAQIKQLQNRPTPTPEIIYKTNTVVEPAPVKYSPVNSIRPCIDLNTGQAVPCLPMP